MNENEFIEWFLNYFEEASKSNYPRFLIEMDVRSKASSLYKYLDNMNSDYWEEYWKDYYEED